MTKDLSFRLLEPQPREPQPRGRELDWLTGISGDLYRPASSVLASGAGAGGLSTMATINTTSGAGGGYSDFAPASSSSALFKRPIYSSSSPKHNDLVYFSSGANGASSDKYQHNSTTAPICASSRHLDSALDSSKAPLSGAALFARDRLDYLHDRADPLAGLAAGLGSTIAGTGAGTATHLSDSLFASTLATSTAATSAAAAAADKREPAPISATAAAGSSSSNNLIRQLFDDMRQIQDTVDSIEIPARGRCRVFMAKYGYDPFKQSPNENPDAELAFNAGDYIMVFDDIDEDGYFIGELMDGRRGYAPSNWLERLTGEDLFDFQADVLYKQAGVSAASTLKQMPLSTAAAAAAAATTTSNTGEPGAPVSASNNQNCLQNLLLLDEEALEGGSYPPEFYDALISDSQNHSNLQHLLAPEDYHRMNDYVDLNDVNEVDDECLSDYERAEAEQMRRAVPPPQRLVLERQLNKCILIAWLHPQSARGTIVSYQVYVDGVLKSTVPSGDRTKALLEGVDSNIPHRISVRAIDPSGRHSNDAGCTIVIGQNIPFAPSCVKASHITSDSALISWLPCNSNFHHVVAVNSVEVQTVRPSVYKHLINGLSANTLYRVWVRAKPGKILSIDEKNPKKLESLTTYVDFKTMPKSLPDPPVNVQVEAGPQRRTLLVTWLPLTLNDFGSSNGCAVTGYAVFAGHKKLADIDSPTGDHALLDICDLESLHKKSVTVRTKSGENLSQDSMPCHIPDEYLKVGHLSANNKEPLASNHQRHNHHHQQHQQQQHHALPNHHQRHHAHLMQSSSSGGGGGVSHSPSRQRMMAARAAALDSQQRATAAAAAGAGQAGRYLSSATQMGRTGRPLARSLQNLESDLDSHRSSIPAIEVTRETSGSELLNQTESYSEEEFESSMRFRAGAHRSKMGGGRGGGARQLRSRQSHSVDGPRLGSASALLQQQQQVQQQQQQQQQQLQNRPYQSQASLIGQQQRLRAATPAGDIRYFVALFDYDPSTMSPNPNAAAEELAFKEGSIIKVYGQLGEDGFFKGEIDTQIGFVPCNVITEITDPNLLASLYEKNNGAHQQLTALAGRPQAQQQQSFNQQVQQQTNHLPTNQLDLQQQQVASSQQQQGGAQAAVKRMIALYDYDPQENSPNADTESEIPFKTGDIIFVYGKMDTDGFYMGEVERTKQRGLVPSNFLKEEPFAKQPQAAQLQQANAVAGIPSQLQQQRSNMPMMPQQQQQLQQMDPQTNQQQIQMQQLRNAAHARGPQQMMMTNQQGTIPQQQQQQQQQQNINRPNSLSLNDSSQHQIGALQNLQQQQQQLGLQNNLSNQPVPSAPMLPQQQQQFQSGNPMSMNMNAAMNNQMGPGQFMQGGPAQQQQLRGLLNQPQMMSQQQPLQQQQQQQMGMNQQQQQAGPGGVLSNLLSSGKQIIGAASTPRVPNQPGSFAANMAMPNQMSGGAGAGMPSNMMTGNQMDGNSLLGANRGNQMLQQPSGHGAFNQTNDISLQQQQAHMGGMGGQHNQMHPQQPQHYNQMGNFNRAPGGQGGMNQMDGDQGGNILNTVKNMFKL